MSESNSLAVLLDRARSGDDDARNRLFERCRTYVGVVARAEVETWLQVKVDASDLVQQTLLEAHRGFADFRGTTDAEWLAWLRKILSHNAADFVRRFKGAAKRNVQREVPLKHDRDETRGIAAGQLAGDVESPSQLVAQMEQDVEIAEAIAELSADHQEVIVLRNLQRLPFDEVARRMGRSRGAAQMLWMRALDSLRKKLGARD
jgi:RNA polymerase sigma-70 factor (ECF subfamily)